MNIINIMLVLFVSLLLGWCILSLLYWYVVRRVFHDAILYRIYKKRDRLRTMAVKGEVDPNSFEFEFLEHRLCLTAYASPGITIFNLIRFYMREETDRPSPKLDKFNELASEPLLQIWSEAIDDVKLMMLANSPIIALIGVFIVLVKDLSKIATDPVKKFFETEVIDGNHESELLLA